ncbi:hypothetical protein C1Y40_05243 [Mycobacterium talmoniae]|uniref:Uncharacterized protein n=1 Tax=Mycobacterium talmoniae TaxID=1858794 RepID=A0A2S8BD61_9MYCO|nr:hypothetical protein C1Y40_05243 [Mycobacterium talmoniae]
MTEARRDADVRAIVDTTFQAFTELFADRFGRDARELSGSASPLRSPKSPPPH